MHKPAHSLQSRWPYAEKLGLLLTLTGLASPTGAKNAKKPIARPLLRLAASHQSLRPEGWGTLSKRRSKH
jgi:hypothetical protein